ncbi:dimethyl sulfoxide reductase anchor subunit family protein [Hugonella massiliensis]|uniref:dimethyl sulfoxide reductase anchor subunit family protein n=1 Tax=Hugonella massiliensis TaxID=1720315 RepID=UPI00073E7408|nr:DmsC/YnfH family molybdoenzyme membrane anchor subunit [Hugonella massiliensis]
METAFAELPLAVFTTLAPLGAGAFLALAVAFSANDYDETALKRIDKLTWVPFVAVLVGFVASALHTANPSHGVFALSGLGHSPLTNEICVGGVFVLVALVYALMATRGKLKGGRKAFALVTGVLGILFALFVGLAYNVATIASWSTPLVPVEVLGFALLGGSAFAALVLAGNEGKAAHTLSLLAVIGAVVAVIAQVAHLVLVAGASNAVSSGAQLVGGAMGCAVVGIVLVLVACFELARGYKGAMTSAIATRAIVESCVGVFMLRLVFYALYLSVGVTVM